MQNIDSLRSLVSSLPPGLQAGVTSLLEEMGTVLEGIGDGDITWKPNYLRLVQGTTDRGSIPKGTAIGDFVLGEKKIEKPLEFIPIRIWDSRQYWDPDQTSNKILCWSPDSKMGSVYGECRQCAFQVWVEGEGSACGKAKTVLAISSDLSQIFTIGFSKSGYSVGMELQTLMKRAGVNSYARTYGLNTTTAPNAKNIEIYKIEILNDEKRKTTEEKLGFLKELFAQVSSDRKEMLDVFYANARAKQALIAASTPLALGNTPSKDESKKEGEGTTIEVEEAVVSVSPMAKAYKL